ncbi:unnamed protein product, partial [Anisakis simplex]|uniref:Kinesin motor domain-containing protein n=1 Tax=Anisakis simplex TaxID=6269 RepID=A0A0M3JAJ4_ANISI
PNDHGDGVSDASNAKKRRLGDSQNISGTTPKRDALRNEIGSETVLRQTDGYNDDDGYEETVVVDELGSMGSDDRQLDDEDFEPGGSMTRSRFIETRQKQGYSGGSGAGVSGMSARSTLRSRISVGSILPPPTISMENAVPATAPLLTTDRTKIRHNKRNKTEDRDGKEVAERVVVGRRYDRIPSVSTPSTTAVSTMSSSLSSHQQPRILDRRSG